MTFALRWWKFVGRKFPRATLEIIGGDVLKRFLCVLGCTLVLSGCPKDSALRSVDNELDQYGYTAYIPPRANHGPGWVFRFARTFDGRSVPVTVCDRLYGSGVNPVVKGDISFERVQRSRTFDLDLGLSLVADLLKDVQKAQANLKDKSIKELTVSWGRLQAEEIPSTSRFSEDGKLLPVDGRCAVALREIKQRGELEGVFVVTDAVRADDLDVAFSRDAGGNVEGVLEVAKLLDFNPKVSWKQVDKSSLKITEPRYLGFRAFTLTDFGVTGLLSSDTARITGKPISIGIFREFMQD